MSNSNNPKSFYNQADYTSGNSASQNNANIIHKPNEITAADLLPPPPYSPDPSSSSQQRKSSDSHYGSTLGRVAAGDEEQQVGLLSQQAQPFLAKEQPQRVAVAPNPSPLQQNIASSSNPHQELDTSNMPSYTRRQSSGGRRRGRADGDPGCCRKWCKYFFAALLIWLVLLKFSDKLGLSSPPLSPPHSQTCHSSSSASWQDIPRIIEFERNIEIVLEGHVSGGRILVTPLEDRHGGSIVSDIQFTPPLLADKMSYDIVQKERDTTQLVLKMPTRFNGKDCINIDMEIRLPYSADLLRVDVSNVNVEIHEAFKKSVDVVDIKSANGHIELKRWSGASIKLVTANGDIKADYLNSDRIIYIETENGHVSFASDVVAKERIDIINSNGGVESMGKIQADDTIDIRSSSGVFQLDKVYADNVFLETSNAGISVRYLEAQEQVIAKNSNAPITMYVGAEKNIKVALATSNDLVQLHLTNEFEGHFVMSTSNGEINVEDLKDSNIVYQDNRRYLKRGDRLGSGNKGDLTITNSNANIFLSFNM